MRFFAFFRLFKSPPHFLPVDAGAVYFLQLGAGYAMKKEGKLGTKHFPPATVAGKYRRGGGSSCRDWHILVKNMAARPPAPECAAKDGETLCGAFLRVIADCPAGRELTAREKKAAGFGRQRSAHST